MIFWFDHLTNMTTCLIFSSEYINITSGQNDAFLWYASSNILFTRSVMYIITIRRELISQMYFFIILDFAWILWIIHISYAMLICGKNKMSSKRQVSIGFYYSLCLLLNWLPWNKCKWKTRSLSTQKWLVLCYCENLMHQSQQVMEYSHLFV